MSCAGSCGFGSIKKKKSSYRPSVKRIKKTRKTRKSRKSRKSKSRTKFGSRKIKVKRHSKKHSRIHKKSQKFGFKTSVSQNYIGDSPIQYENHDANIPDSFRSWTSYT